MYSWSVKRLQSMRKEMIGRWWRFPGFFALCHPIQDFGFADRQPKCSQGLRSVITWSVLNAQERQVFGGRERKALDFNLSLFRITNYKRFFGIAHQSTKCEVRREELDLRTQ